MGTFAVMALLGLALILPIALGASEDEEDTLPEDEPIVDGPEEENPTAPEHEDPASPEDPAPVTGTDGDDLLEITGAQTADGLAGNDTITAQAGDAPLAATLNGGEGFDRLLVSEDYTGQGGAASLDGGPGEDLLSVASDIELGVRADTLTGGEGQDAFEITLDLGSETGGDAPDGLITITDFQPGTEYLSISPASSAAESYYFDGLDLIEAENGAHTDINVRFLPYDAANDPTQTTIRLLGVTALDRGDITLIAPNIGTPADDLLSDPGFERGDDSVPVLAGQAGDDFLASGLDWT